MKIRLHQFLSKTGVFKSKKELIAAIMAGEVEVDGKVVPKPNFQFNPNRKKVSWKGKALERLSDKIYIVINKPEGFLSTRLTENDRNAGKKSVFSLIKTDEKVDEAIKRTLFAVGRLDEDTSGLLVITNDGDFGYKIASPGAGVEKAYFAALEKPISEADAKKIECGVLIDVQKDEKTEKYLTKKCKVAVDPDRSKARITISEGKKREVRKIFEAVGNRVVSLNRVAIGNLSLEKLSIKKGEYKFMQKELIKEMIFGKKQQA